MNPALLIIDVQKGIDEANHWGGNRNNPEAEGNIKLLLTFWRQHRFPIIIIKHDSLETTSPLRPGQIGNELKQFVVPIDGEIVIAKSTANAFLNTELAQQLIARSVDEIYITGFVTNNSVEATARMSGELGFRTNVLSDATACFNKIGLDGTVYTSELVHQLSLVNLSGEYANIYTTRAVIDNLTKLLA